MRKSALKFMIQDRLSVLVHERAKNKPTECFQHELFMLPRILYGLITLAALPLLLLASALPLYTSAVPFLCLLAPIASIMVLSRTGHLLKAQFVSCLGALGLVIWTALFSGSIFLTIGVLAFSVMNEAILNVTKHKIFAFVSGTVAVTCLSIAGHNAFVMPGLTGQSLENTIFYLILLSAQITGAVSYLYWKNVQKNKPNSFESDHNWLNIIDDLVTWHDQNGHVLKSSSASSKIFKTGSATLQGRGLLSRVHIQDRPTYLKALSDAAIGNKPVSAEFRVHIGDLCTQNKSQKVEDVVLKSYKKHSEVIWVEMRAHGLPKTEPLPVPPGSQESHLSVIAVMRDITSHKHYEHELEEARAIAYKADESKARFLATVSHELRTPLNAIIGFSEILADSNSMGVDLARQKDYAKVIHESGHHLLEVVNALLDMSKIETGHFTLVPEAFNPTSLAKSCYDLMRLKAEQKNITLHLDSAADMPELIADRRACKQVLINLLSNAIKFTPANGHITLGLASKANQIIFSVSDTGIGIAEEDLSQIGNPFFQARSNYDRTHEGTGLGLSVVRGLIALHHGQVSIESAPGQGTCVTVGLPSDSRITLKPPSNLLRIDARAKQPHQKEKGNNRVLKSA